ncbi:biopolymer transporter ExbD [Rubellicoccus peritrichatus]|uniref:Biopolymer transporter ExbD n=1 Tax=Rubellicoccus peritrichatus TaxID=3080537 RepID=A0AAQ3LE12_9BACT|nr:biopolymer transporter ExbD [Puniceicoccus sp. CR14]WOO43662.1 biopolymer transporter ExbD [Puniceicoccus sp. CR14]
MIQRKKRPEEKVTIPIAPMIDCVFLLLIYFMVSSTLQRQEADISFQLPGTVEQDEPLEMPDEQIIEITDQGQVIVNDYKYDNPQSARYIELASMLTRFRQASDANQVEALVTVAPSDGTAHQMIIKVMDAISLAGIEGVNFSFGEE